MSDLKDMDGNTVSLLKLCSLEPEWARSRIEILQARVDALEADLRGAYNQGFSDGFDSKDKTLMGIGAAADIGFNRFMSLDNSEGENNEW